MPEANQINLLENEPYKIPRMTLKPSSFRVDTNRGRKPIEIDKDASDQDIQALANSRQQTIIRYKGYHGTRKQITEFIPETPAATLLYIETADGNKTLINSIDTPSPDFIIKCENYADKNDVDLVIHRQDGSSRYIPALTPETRQRYRENPPEMTGCTRCGSITCGTGMTKASPQCKPMK